MQDIMDSSAIGQTQAVGDWGNTLHHLKWTNKMWTELATEPQHQGLRWPVKDPRHHPVVDGEL
jgi:hypothetical protein